jgi:rhodanese-related sulfurtransferase
MNHHRQSEPILIPQIDVMEAARRQGEAAILLDVRTPEEYHAGHAPSAIWIPLDEIANRIGELDRNKAILAICRAGSRSQSAAEFLALQGYSTSNVTGGMSAWAAAGLDITTDGTGSGEII